VTPRGGIALAGGPEEIEGALTMVLGTAPGERVMRPDFGCRIWDHVFAPINPTTLGAMGQAVREAVVRWEPRVELESVDPRASADEPGRVDIELTYTIRSTNDRRNLVHPFYVIPGEESP
jgi:hypothetical protein